MEKNPSHRRKRAGEIRLFWVVLWAISVAFALGLYRPNWEALEQRRERKREILSEIELTTEENARRRTGIELLKAGDVRTWEAVIRERYKDARPGEAPLDDGRDG